jgi:hypothetical protein
MEAFEEAKIDLGNNSAEFKALGTVTLSTKRGGNSVHGAVYDYYSTGAFRANDYFTAARSGTPNHGFGTYVSGSLRSSRSATAESIVPAPDQAGRSHRRRITGRVPRRSHRSPLGRGSD